MTEEELRRESDLILQRAANEMIELGCTCDQVGALLLGSGAGMLSAVGFPQETIHDLVAHLFDEGYIQ